MRVRVTLALVPLVLVRPAEACSTAHIANGFVIEYSYDALTQPARTPEERDLQIQRVRPLIRSLARSIQKFRGDMDSKGRSLDDHIQEIELKVFQALATWTRKKGALTTYVHQVATNLIIDMTRSNKTWGKVAGVRMADSDDADFVRTRPDPSAESPMVAAMKRERSEALRLAIEKLPPEWQECVRMTYFDGLSQNEIAAKLNIERSTVSWRLIKATNRLREYLRTLEGDFSEVQTEPGRVGVE